jgi:hypothetical protein
LGSLARRIRDAPEKDVVDSNRLNLSIIAALLGALSALAACATGENQASGYPPKPDVVIVRAFEVPEGVVVLDPSFGFSLRRGEPGVPREERAATVGRAAAFMLSDALIGETRAAGLDAVSASSPAPAPAVKALVVGGTFRQIDQGLRRRVGQIAPGAGQSRVVADAQIDYALPGSAPQRLLTVHADSGDGAPTPVGSRGDLGLPVADANADAARAGRIIARAIVDLARQANWLAPRR